MLDNYYSIRSFQQIADALQGPVVCWLRDGKWHPVSDLSGYLGWRVGYMTWLLAFRKLDSPHGPPVPPGTTVDDTLRIGREAALAAAFAALAEKGQCETK